MRVLKVGGTSVDSAERMRGVAEIVVGRAREGSPLLVVVSAVGGMTAFDAAARPATLDALEGELATAGFVDPVFVDCTAEDGVSSWYGLAFEAGLHVVTVNKKANSAAIADYRRLHGTAARLKRRFLYETNVGAGLPIISTLRSLLEGGDRVLRLEAILSGSLSFLLGALQDGVPFSEAVRTARERGFTEPDPRDDLSGRDVARKILILARETGAALEFDNVEVEGVLPPTSTPPARSTTSSPASPSSTPASRTASGPSPRPAAPSATPPSWRRDRTASGAAWASKRWGRTTPCSPSGAERTPSPSSPSTAGPPRSWCEATALAATSPLPGRWRIF